MSIIKVIKVFTTVIILLCSVFTLGLIVSCKGGIASEEAEEESAEETTGYIDVTPEEAKDLIENNPDLIIIDVSPNYASGHLSGALNYYLGDGSLDNAIPTLDKEAKYLVYCHIDSAAILRAQKLADSRFKNVYRLEGNYSSWIDAGYEVEV